MSDQPDNLILVCLRRIEGRLGRLQAGMLEVKERLGLLEGIRSSLSRRVDRVDERPGRAGRRLDLADAALR